MGLLDMMGNDNALLGLHLLAAAAPKERRTTFGEGLLSGLQGVKAQRDAEEDRKRRQQMQDMQGQLIQAQIGETQAQAQQREALALAQQRELERKAAFQRDLQEQFSPVTPLQAIEASGTGPSPAAAGLIGQQRTPNWQAMGAKYPDQIDLLKKLAEAQNFGRQKVARTADGKDAQGRPVTLQLDEYGQPVGSPIEQWKAADVRDFGGFLGSVDPVTGAVKRLGDKTQSPDSKASNALGWANYGIANQRLQLDKLTSGENKAPQGYRWKSDGTLEPIKGGPADRQATASEGERKAATLLARLEGSMGQLSEVVNKNPGAAKPGVLASMAGSTPFIGEAFRNTVNSADRQRVEAAQLDMLDAALTLGTGAAYTKEQLEGYRRAYFPQLGDDAATVADKQKRLETVIRAARISAGRAAGSADNAAGIGKASGDLTPAEQEELNRLRMQLGR